jgi:transcriptional regulator with XRE-family HTH domain
LEVARRARDGESQSALAAEFGISQSAISRIKKMGGYKQQMERP